MAKRPIAKGASNGDFDPAVSIGFSNLVALFNCSTKTLQIMIDGGYVTKGRDGYYKLSEAVQGAMRYKSDHGIKKSGATKNASAQRVQDARAKQIEQATAMQAKELVTFDTATAMIDLLLGGISVELDGLPAQLTRDRALRAEYQKKIADTKRRLLAKWEKLQRDVDADDEAEIDDVVDDDEEEDA